MLVLGELGEQEAEHAVAHDHVVDLGHLRELTVAIVEHLARDRERRAALANDVAEVQQGDQRPRVCALVVELLRIAHHHHVLVARDPERVEGAAVGRAPDLEVEPRVAKLARLARDHVARRRPVRDHLDLRAGGEVLVELRDD